MTENHSNSDEETMRTEIRKLNSTLHTLRFRIEEYDESLQRLRRLYIQQANDIGVLKKWLNDLDSKLNQPLFGQNYKTLLPKISNKYPWD